LDSGDLDLIFEKTRPDLPDEARVEAPFKSANKPMREDVRPNYGWRATGRKPES